MYANEICRYVHTLVGLTNYCPILTSLLNAVIHVFLMRYRQNVALTLMLQRQYNLHNRLLCCVRDKIANSRVAYISQAWQQCFGYPKSTSDYNKLYL